MKAERKEVVASVGLVGTKISQDELAVLEPALSYILDTLGDSEIEQRFGATRDEVEGIRDDLREALSAQGEAEPVAEMSEKS
jgi:uncharacterized small protein (DUF1192 family)